MRVDTSVSPENAGAVVGTRGEENSHLDRDKSCRGSADNHLNVEAGSLAERTRVANHSIYTQYQVYDLSLIHI